jgi:hypothetical protein
MNQPEWANCHQKNPEDVIRGGIEQTAEARVGLFRSLGVAVA